MVDPHSEIRAFLLTDSTLAALIGTRLWAGRDVPPVGYQPDDGPGIAFKVRGGGPDYDDALLNPSVQFKCYAASEVAAYACYRTLFDALHNGHDDDILHAEIEILGQTLEEPETNWHFVLAYFLVMLRSE